MIARVKAAVLLVTLTAVAHAQAPDVTREFQAGVDAFRLGKYDEARAHLEKARQLDPTLAGPNRFLAAVAQAQQRWADCIDLARQALKLNPRSSELADTRKLHDECRTASGKPPYRDPLGESAAVAVTANVAGASVKINGLTYGGTPIPPRPIAPGPLAIDVEKAGWLPKHVDVDGLPGVVTDVAIELEPDAKAQTTADLAPTTIAKPTTGTLIASEAFTIDGAPATSPAQLAPGTHVVEVRKPGFDPWRRRVQIAAGQKTQLAPDLIETKPREQRERLGLWLVTYGGAFAAFGFTSFVVSRRASDEARDILRVETARPPGSIDESVEPVRTRADFDAARDRATRWATISTVSYAAAIATAGAGGYLLYRNATQRTDTAPPFALAPTRGGAAVVLERAW
jgi:PEGA domain-containing protein/tetratricopeptide repeat protein